jgi:phosphatidylglycerophosphate synthase
MPAPSSHSWFASDAILYDVLYDPMAAHLCWLHPNIVTAACFLLIVPIIYGMNVGWPLWILLVVTFVRQSLDCLDGAIARRCGTASKLGALLDIVEDTVTVGALCLFVLWMVWNRPLLRLLLVYIVTHALIVYVSQIADHVAGRSITYSAFEQYIHDNTVITSLATIALFQWFIHIG